MASGISYPVRSPQLVLTYQGANITSDISRSVIAINYVDYLDGLSGEVEITVEDSGRRWQGPWYPALGDQINVMIGYGGEPLMACGDFQVDELELSGSAKIAPGDVFTMRCLAAFVTPAMRTPNSAGYEGQSLLQIARTIAGKYGLSVVCAPEAADLSFARVTQKHESDLAFLKRLAREHGYDFTVRGTMLVFYPRSALESAPAVATLARSDLESFEFRNRTHRIYRAAEVAYHDPVSKTLIAQSAQAQASIPVSDRLKLAPRCENGQQALIKAQAALHERNLEFAEGLLVAPGSTALAAGNNVLLAGFGEFAGTYMILAASHRLERARGYRTHLEVRRVA